MALFNCIATSKSKVNGESLNKKFILLELKSIKLFPISSSFDEEYYSIGIYCGSKNLISIEDIKIEMHVLFESLFELDFEIFDLYIGDVLLRETYHKTMNYL